MKRCIALLGGSFDPVHNGHIALGKLFAEQLKADALLVIPALPWQKGALVATPQQRVDMLTLAFTGLPCPVEVAVARLCEGRIPRPPALRVLAKAHAALAGHSWLWRRRT